MLKVRHVTHYRYARPVGFGEHRLMLRPREDPDQRLVFERLRITPEPEMLRIERDRLGNFVAIARFGGAAPELCFESELVVARELEAPLPLPPLPGLRPFPRGVQAEDRDLDAWAARFLDPRCAPGLQAVAAMNAHVSRTFTYRRRLEPGVQSPEQTLALRSGACRDFARLIVEAARRLGLTARFVSGYVHCPDPGEGPARTGSGHTHAWAQVLTPEAGWIDFDPTSGRLGPQGLIRIAVAEHPAEAVPIQGVYDGAAEDFLDMHVEVSVQAAERPVDSPPRFEPSPLWSVA
ncbi:MAG TPA: transglutaminase family protein [Caulobacteraceae bacterium]|nr:transglutaminase family protein [Caulobacteraceae bacterium]